MHMFTVWIFDTRFLRWIYYFCQCSTPLVDMRLCRHVPNSPRDKNKSMQHPSTSKSCFLASKTLPFPIGIGKKTFFYQL
jgi:hypothetical protein